MKKSAILMTALAAMALPFSAFSVSAAEETAKIHIKITLSETVVDSDITVKDTNNDGKLTVEDALYTAHEQFYPGGAAAGYSDELIWGKPCSGGYSLINPDEYPLEDRPYNERTEIRDGDTLDWGMHCYNTDSYSFILDAEEAYRDGEPIAQGTKIIFYGVHNTMTDNGTEPVEGIELLIDGQKSGIKTDANGTAAFTLDKLGTYTISGDLSKYDTVFDNKFKFNVVSADSVATIHLSIWTPEFADHAAMDIPINVYDYDGDGRITSDDALRLMHHYYGRDNELGQNMILGTSGKYVCNVYDGEKLVWSGSAVDKNSESYDLKQGLLVRFRPADEETKPAQTDAVKTAAEAKSETVTTEASTAQSEAAKTETTAAQSEAATTAASTAGQKAAAKASTNASADAAPAVSGAAKTNGAQTGEDMPVAALAITGLAAAAWVVVFCRKQF